MRFSAIIELVRELLISNMQTNWSRIHEKFGKLSCQQGNVNADADAVDAELQLQWPTV